MSVRDRYRSQKANAKTRGIEWLFTFESWLAVWLESGKLHLRGRGVGRYCMARRGDVGPYSPANVEVIPIEKNAADAKRNKPETAAALSARAIGMGRGWTYVRRGYQVTCAGRYVGRFPTQAEAESAYAAAVVARTEELRNPFARVAGLNPLDADTQRSKP